MVELPVSQVAGQDTTLNVWATTSRARYTVRKPTTAGLELDRGDPEQIERVGNPAINTVLIPAARKDEFNRGLPETDARDFAGVIVASLQALGTDQENINILAGVAVPDVLTIDTSLPSGFPNGRGLADDVIDIILTFVFNQVPTGDGADGNDVAFLSTFPYLAPPHVGP